MYWHLFVLSSSLNAGAELEVSCFFSDGEEERPPQSGENFNIEYADNSRDGGVIKTCEGNQLVLDAKAGELTCEIQGEAEFGANGLYKLHCVIAPTDADE